MTKEGYIQFSCTWIEADPLPWAELEELNRWRQRLFDLGLITGLCDQSIGYGNISARLGRDPGFVISGTATGGIRQLTAEHYVEIISYDLARNSISCQGPIKASSESLTHAAVYQTRPDIAAVIHVHQRKMWSDLLAKVPTTAESISQGSPEMAEQVMAFAVKSEEGIIVMAGHQDGLLFYGRSLEHAGNSVLDCLKKSGGE